MYFIETFTPTFSNSIWTFKHMMNNSPVEQSSYPFEHFHTDYELFLFIRGSAHFMIEGCKYELNPYDLLLIKPGQHHQIQLDHNIDYERYVINFSISANNFGLAEAIDKCSTAYAILGTPLTDLFAQLDKHYDMYPSGFARREMLASTLTQILVGLCFSQDKAKKIEPVNSLFSDIVSFIDANLVQINTESDIAKGLYKGSATIRKIFAEYADVPIMTYIRSKKCMLANSLMKSGAKPTHIYEQCGFRDYSTFYRVYTKTMNETPSATYRSAVDIMR